MPTVDPTVLPTPLSVPATPFVDAFDLVALRGRELREVPRLAVDAERGRLFEVFRAVRALPLEVFLAVLRVPADDPDLRVERRALDALRLVACAILLPLSRDSVIPHPCGFCTGGLPGGGRFNRHAQICKLGIRPRRLGLRHVAKLGRGPAVRARGGGASRLHRGAEECHRPDSRGGADRARDRVGSLVHRHRVHRRHDDPDGPHEPRARPRPRRGAGEGRGWHRDPRPERAARGRGPGAREPRRHRRADRVGCDLDRDARDRASVSGTSPARSSRSSW